MSNELEIVTLNAQAAIPEIEVVIGQAQFGKYQIHLWDNNGHQPVQIGAGINTDNTPDRFPIGSAAALDNRILNWDVIVAAFNSSPGQLYSVTIKIMQDGAVADNGEFEYTDRLDGVKMISDIVRLKVQ